MICNEYEDTIFNDPYNKQGLRTVRNTDCFDYNCGGYALGVMSWYSPIEGFAYSFKTRKENEQKMEILARAMLDEFSDLRVITGLKELQKDEYAIAFRITADRWENDFHFLRRAKNGRWS